MSIDDNASVQGHQALSAASVANLSINLCNRSLAMERGLFFARIPPTVSAGDICAFFSSVGEVELCNLYKPWATAKASKVIVQRRFPCIVAFACGNS
jgi:hypothetical protein